MNELLTKGLGHTEFKDSELGKIPKSWKVKRLGDVAKIYSGGTPSRSNNSYYIGCNPWVKSGEVNQRKIYNTEEFVSDEAIEKSSAKWVKRGSILIAMYGATAGKVSRLMLDATINQAISAICADERFSTDEYLFHEVEFLSRGLLNSVQGSGQPNLSGQLIKRSLVLIPPLPEQRKIASILTSVDEVIENTHKQIEKLRDLKKATMNELLTKGIGHTEFKDSELGRIPKSWEVSCLADIVREKPSYGANAPAVSSQDSEIRFLRITDINEEGQLRVDSKAYIKEEDAVRYELHKDDLVIARTGNTVGKAYLHSKDLKTSEKIAYAGYLILFRFDNEKARPKFIFQYTLSRMFKDWVDENSRVGAQPNINAQEYLSFSLPLPSVNEQDRIIKILTSIDNNIYFFEEKLCKTESLKKSLMQDLLTGKVRVKVN